MVAFAAKHPAALGAQFLAALLYKLTNEQGRPTLDLRTCSAAQWAQQFADPSEIHDQDEAATLAAGINHVDQEEIGQALVVLVRRLGALQGAKTAGGSRDTAQTIEPLPTAGSAAPGPMRALTQG